MNLFFFYSEPQLVRQRRTELLRLSLDGGWPLGCLPLGDTLIEEKLTLFSSEEAGAQEGPLPKVTCCPQNPKSKGCSKHPGHECRG